MTNRILGKDKTTVQIKWDTKDRLSCFRLEVNRYKRQSGIHNEGDAELLERMVSLIEKLAKTKLMKDTTTRLLTFEKILEELNQPSAEPKSALPWHSQNVKKNRASKRKL